MHPLLFTSKFEDNFSTDLCASWVVCFIFSRLNEQELVGPVRQANAVNIIFSTFEIRSKAILTDLVPPYLDAGPPQAQFPQFGRREKS